RSGRSQLGTEEIMTTPVIGRLFLAVAFSVGLTGCATTQQEAPADNPGAASVPAASAPAPSTQAPSAAPNAAIPPQTAITLHGKIVAVDAGSRQVTLQGPNGKNVTFTVNNPYNLQSLKAGDRFVAQLTESIIIVGKGPSDTPPVASVAAGLWSAAPGQTPGAVAATQVHLVVVVAAIDRAAQRVTS